MSQFSSGKYPDRITPRGLPIHVGLTNPVNLILQAARLAPGANIYYADLPERPSQDMIDHAVRVLRLRARLKES
jgi:hypothetical protein